MVSLTCPLFTRLKYHHISCRWRRSHGSIRTQSLGHVSQARQGYTTTNISGGLPQRFWNFQHFLILYNYCYYHCQNSLDNNTRACHISTQHQYTDYWTAYYSGPEIPLQICLCRHGPEDSVIYVLLRAQECDWTNQEEAVRKTEVFSSRCSGDPNILTVNWIKYL